MKRRREKTRDVSVACCQLGKLGTRWEWKNNELADIRCPLSIYLCGASERAPPSKRRHAKKGAPFGTEARISRTFVHVLLYIDATNFALRTVPRRAAKPISSQFESPAMSSDRTEREKQSKEQRSILLNCRFAAGSRCAKKRREARALH